MFQIRSFSRWMGEILGAQSVFAARLPVCGESCLVIETETKEEEKKKNHRNGCSHLKCEESKAERRFILSLFLSSFFVLFSYLL